MEYAFGEVGSADVDRVRWFGKTKPRPAILGWDVCISYLSVKREGRLCLGAMFVSGGRGISAWYGQAGVQRASSICSACIYSMIFCSFSSLFTCFVDLFLSGGT